MLFSFSLFLILLFEIDVTINRWMILSKRLNFCWLLTLIQFVRSCFVINKKELMHFISSLNFLLSIRIFWTFTSILTSIEINQNKFNKKWIFDDFELTKIYIFRLMFLLRIKVGVKNMKIKKLNFKVSEGSWLYTTSSTVNRCHENNSWISFEWIKIDVEWHCLLMNSNDYF